MLDGALGGRRQIVETLLKIGPLLIMGLGLTVAFRCQVWNIGGEGNISWARWVRCWWACGCKRRRRRGWSSR
ncbi:MAG: hypothetical protein R3A10_08275 [Caldilineaceae bacterium]